MRIVFLLKLTISLGSVLFIHFLDRVKWRITLLNSNFSIANELNQFHLAKFK
jgi:hypothetical protein